jgi:uncharacterized protein YkwD
VSCDDRTPSDRGRCNVGHYSVTRNIPPACKNACRAEGWGLLVGRQRSTIIALVLAVSASLLGGAATFAAGSTTPRTSQGRGPCRDTSLRPAPGNTARVASATLCLIERERTAYHLSALRSNDSLKRIASTQAKDMVVGDYFGDDTLGGSTPWQRITSSHYATDARSVSVAQNIGWGTGSLATPAAIVNAWMLSPPHREIMLAGGYRDVGVGVAPAAPSSLNEGKQGATYTVEFAARG